METMVVVNGMTAHRANVIYARTGSSAMGVIKAQMIDLLKEKLKSGVAHFLRKNRRICNYLRIKRLFGLHRNWVTRWQPFLFQSSLLFCINDITPDTQRYNFFMNEQKDGAFFIIAG